MTLDQGQEWPWPLVHVYLNVLIMSPTKGEGDILFLVRIPLVSASVLTWHFLVCTISHYWEGGKKWLDFGDLDLIFKVTPGLRNSQILTKKAFSAPYLLHQMTDSGQTSYIVMLGWFKDLIRFWWPWPNFQNHHTIKTVKISFVCTLSPEPIGGFWPNLHGNTTGTWGRND